MAKKAYIGVGGKARRVKRMYVGVNGIARKVKKAYIGVGGTARPCFFEGLEYYGTATRLSVAMERLAATTVGNYALFGGGYGGNGKASAVVSAYNASLTRSAPTDMILGGADLAATAVGSYALFGGGYNSKYQRTVDAYNTSLTHSNPE